MECSTIDTYRSLESDRIYNDATLLESIFKDAANDQLDQDDVLQYIEQFQLQIIAPLVCIAICLVTLIVLSICLCRRVNIRLWDRQKKRCRIFYLISSGLLFVCMCMSIYFSESITNSLLKSSCQFEDSRKEAEGLMVNLNTTVVNITENLDMFVTKVVNSLGDTPPSEGLNNYTASLDDLYNYASNTPSCTLPECQILVVDGFSTRQGLYYCSLCLNAQPVQLISTFLQDNVQPPVQDMETFLDSMDTNFVQAKGAISDGLNSLSDVRTEFLSKEGTWGEVAASAIEFTYALNPWYVLITFILLIAAVPLSIVPGDRDYPRINCLSYLTCCSIVFFLSIGMVFVPLITVSNDVCTVVHSLPDNVNEYIPTGAEDVVEIVNKCFGDGKLPQKYLDSFDFVDTIGDCPQYNVNAIFDGIPSLTLVVDSMNDFTNNDINSQADAMYKQRMQDIMKIKEKTQKTTQYEQTVKQSLGTTIDNILQICSDVDPLFNLIRQEIQSISCKVVGQIYYVTVDSFCEDIVDSLQNFTIVLYITVFIALMYFLGIFAYFVSGDYLLLNRTSRDLIA